MEQILQTSKLPMLNDFLRLGEVFSPLLLQIIFYF
jgi:hypothetical protein